MRYKFYNTLVDFFTALDVWAAKAWLWAWHHRARYAAKEEHQP